MLLMAKNGNKAILMYSTFDFNGTAMMHMHLISSDADNHYIATYTDLYDTLSNENYGNGI